MSLTFDDIRLKEAKKIALQEKLQICADLVSELHAEVAKQFELETKLSADDHWSFLSDTEYFADHTNNVGKAYVSVRYVLRKKSFFRDAIVLVGTIFITRKTSSNFYIDGPVKLDVDCLNKYISHLSIKLAQIKGK